MIRDIRAARAFESGDQMYRIARSYFSGDCLAAEEAIRRVMRRPWYRWLAHFVR